MFLCVGVHIDYARLGLTRDRARARARVRVRVRVRARVRVRVRARVRVRVRLRVRVRVRVRVRTSLAVSKHESCSYNTRHRLYLGRDLRWGKVTTPLLPRKIRSSRF
jgi:hypothetical protein